MPRAFFVAPFRMFDLRARLLHLSAEIYKKCSVQDYVILRRKVCISYRAELWNDTLTVCVMEMVMS